MSFNFDFDRNSIDNSLKEKGENRTLNISDSEGRAQHKLHAPAFVFGSSAASSNNLSNLATATTTPSASTFNIPKQQQGMCIVF